MLLPAQMMPKTGNSQYGLMHETTCGGCSVAECQGEGLSFSRFSRALDQKGKDAMYDIHEHILVRLCKMLHVNDAQNL